MSKAMTKYYGLALIGGVTSFAASMGFFEGVKYIIMNSSHPAYILGREGLPPKYWAGDLDLKIRPAQLVMSLGLATIVGVGFAVYGLYQGILSCSWRIQTMHRMRQKVLRH